jgi:3',5'-cyclic AMP phosphodiesterase CpdA
MTELLKIVVMSDIHLGPAGRVKFGLDTAARFRAAVSDVTRLYGDSDLCVFAGDLTDHAEPEAYYHFETLRRAVDLPQLVMLGNHDDRNVYLETAVNPMRDENGHVQGYRDIKGHRILMLDSSEPGHVEGVLCDQRLGWAAARLQEARAAGLKVIVLIHHNPCALQMPVDTYRLSRPERLLSVLRGSKADIIQILAGHCHITTAGSWGGFPCATISGNQHRVEAFLRGRTGQQLSYEGPAQFAVIVSNGSDCVLHFHNYVDRNIALPDAMFPWKCDQKFEML